MSSWLFKLDLDGSLQKLHRRMYVTVSSLSFFFLSLIFSGGMQYLLPIARELNKIPLPTLNAAYSHIALPEPHLMLGHPNFTLVPRYPAPESLGLFRTGEEGSEDESDEDGDGESEEMDDDEEDEEEGSSQRAGEEQAKATSQERNDDGEASNGDRMETDTTNQHTTDASTPIATTNQAETQAESVRVNGVKRHLEEDDDYDA